MRRADCTGPGSPRRLPAPLPVTQLALDLGPPPPPSFDNFVAGGNGEALAAARALLSPRRAGDSRFLYLWGPRASGRSHLLEALAAAAGAGRARRLGPDAPIEGFVHDPAVRVWLLDDCDALDDARQVAAFHLLDAVRAHPDAVAASAGAEPPARLAVRPELATRLGWGLVLQLRPLSDDDAAEALRRSLAERGVAASADLVPWLMARAPRDLGTLRALLDALDAHALARQRPLSLALARELLQSDLRFEAPAAREGGGPLP